MFALFVTGILFLAFSACSLVWKKWFDEFYDRATSRRHSDEFLTFQRYFLGTVSLLVAALAFVGGLMI